MKVKELLEFLKKCDAEAELYINMDKIYPIAIVQQGFLDLETLYSYPLKQDNYTEFGVYFLAPNADVDGEVEPDELTLVDTKLMPNIKLGK